MPEALSWKPVRKGRRYCAPACGHGCTYGEYRAAQIKSKALSMMLGPEWQPHVWENMGWHYCAKSHNGFIKVHPLINGGEYHAFLGKDSAGGRWVSDGHKDPKECVRDVVRMAKDEALETLALILEVISC